MTPARPKTSMGDLGPLLDAAVLARRLELPLKPDGAEIRGRFVHLTPYDTKAHDDVLHALFDGRSVLGHPAFDADALVWRYMRGGGTDRSFSAFKAVMRERRDAADQRTFVMTLPGGTPVGLISLMANRPSDLNVEIGGIMVTPAYQRTPVATEASFLLLQHAFALGYRRVEWKCNNLNERSKAAATRLGFTFEGVFRSHMIVHAGYSRDTAWFSVLHTEWPQVHVKLREWLDSDAAADLLKRREQELEKLAASAE